jgi:stearoyl-CoA desaturase (Delta-9 desaturase)
MNVPLTVTECILMGCALSFVATIDTTTYLHRSLTHNGVVFHPVIAFFKELKLWLLTGIKPREWVAVHLKHHKFTDMNGDPHSPALEGFWKIQLWNAFYYRDALKDPTIVATYAKHVKLSCGEKLFKHGALGPALGIVVLIMTIGPIRALIVSITHVLLYVFFLNNLVNGLCHNPNTKQGYKNFNNTAQNIKWVASITGGEGLHNNHHAQPSSPSFAARRKEEKFDLGYKLIKLHCRLGLATITRLPRSVE